MSREIKFRIWEEKIRLRSKNEVLNRYSDYTNKTSDGIEYSYEFSPMTGQVMCEIEYDEPYSELVGEPTGARWNATGDVALEQYTGLKDKSGKEIYEGDIVILSPSYRYARCNGEDFGQPPLVVEFDDGEWLLSEKPYNGWQNVLYQEKGYVEVIGNIHENPELLEGKK